MAAKAAALARWKPEELDALVVAKPAAADGPPGPADTVLLLFDRGGPDDARLARVLAAAAAAHRDRVRAGAVSAEAVRPRLQAWQEKRRAYDTFDFTRWPAVGVFRGGRLITTFHPRRVFFAEALQAREEREQIEIFLAKLVYYDPAAVKEQKSLELEAEA